MKSYLRFFSSFIHSLIQHSPFFYNLILFMGCAVDEEMNYEKMDGRRELGSSNVYVIYL